MCREISKLHDTTHRDTLGALAEYFAVNQARGEIVIVIGAPPRADASERRHKNKYRNNNDESSEE